MNHPHQHVIARAGVAVAVVHHVKVETLNPFDITFKWIMNDHRELYRALSSLLLLFYLFVLHMQLNQSDFSKPSNWSYFLCLLLSFSLFICGVIFTLFPHVSLSLTHHPSSCYISTMSRQSVSLHRWFSTTTFSHFTAMSNRWWQWKWWRFRHYEWWVLEASVNRSIG